LRTTDPLAADQIHPNDGIRIIRALEVLELTGRSIVAHQHEHRFGEAPYEFLRIGLSLDRERLNDRIERRTERMIADGFAEEVRRLLDMGYTESLKPMQSLGYRNMISFLAGRQSLEEAVRLIKRDTCRYAKRQMTWFAADREVVWLDPGDVDAASKRIDPFLHPG
jgi:tRNA dimethylallyltransferase